MADVKFLKGTQANYDALESKNPNTFYYTENNLYLGELKLTNANDIEEVLTSLTNIETNIDNIESSIGTLTDLSTVAKNNLVAAINEVLSKVTDSTTASEVTIEESTTDPTYSKVYTVKQGAVTIGTINIPKDMFVSSGKVETNPDEEHIGTFVILTLANATADKLYIDVGKLVDIYIPKAGATQVQIAIDPTTREISASLVACSVTETELANNAVTTNKILDGNVTYDKLEASIQNSLGKADSAVQSVIESTKNGFITVDGQDVKIHGLGDAAFKSVTDFEVAGAAEQALENAKAYADELLSWGTF